MQLLNKTETEVKKSRFINYAYRIDDISEIKTILEDLRKEHKKAKHIVYAYKFGNTAGKSDDKEPSGTAAGPIFNLMETQRIENTLIVVVRYFGGTKLGAGLLTRTYKNAALSLIKK